MHLAIRALIEIAGREDVGKQRKKINKFIYLCFSILDSNKENQVKVDLPRQDQNQQSPAKFISGSMCLICDEECETSSEALKHVQANHADL